MTINDLFVGVMDVLKPVLMLSGWLAFTLSMISLLINTIINSATGKGFTIGLR